jgi:hypothetical protein
MVKVKKTMENPAAPPINRRWIGFSEDDAKRIAEGANIRRRSRGDVYQRVERKAPWEPRSFTEDNSFHQFFVTSYGRGGGVGRGLGGGLDLGVGVGRGVELGAGVAVGVTVAVGVAVAVTVAVAVAVGVALDAAVAVAVAVAVGVKVAVAVGVGLGVPAGPTVQPPAGGPPSPLQKY